MTNLALIPFLPSVGGPEVLILLVVVLLLFGAKRIPELAKGLGTGIREFKQGVSGETDKDEVKNAEEKKGEALTTSAGAEDTRDARMQEEAERASVRTAEHATERTDERTEHKR